MAEAMVMIVNLENTLLLSQVMYIYIDVKSL
jgi:hypothetical protein